MSDTAALPLNKIHMLEDCCAIEEKCADIYRHFAKIFSDFPDICLIWNKIAAEEDHHGNVIRLAIRNIKIGMFDVEPDYKQFKKVLSKLDSIHRKAIVTHPSLADAFELALEIERSLAECHIESILKFADFDVSNLFVQMEKYDQGHLEFLENAVNSLR